MHLRLLMIACIWFFANVRPLRGQNAAATDIRPLRGREVKKPLFRDPIYDGAADPVVIWNKQQKKWWMLYTNRRANIIDSTGVQWVHGTRIGIAESVDG